MILNIIDILNDKIGIKDTSIVTTYNGLFQSLDLFLQDIKIRLDLDNYRVIFNLLRSLCFSLIQTTPEFSGIESLYLFMGCCYVKEEPNKLVCVKDAKSWMFLGDWYENVSKNRNDISMVLACYKMAYDGGMYFIRDKIVLLIHKIGGDHNTRKVINRSVKHSSVTKPVNRSNTSPRCIFPEMPVCFDIGDTFLKVIEEETNKSGLVSSYIFNACSVYIESLESVKGLCLMQEESKLHQFKAVIKTNYSKFLSWFMMSMTSCGYDFYTKSLRKFDYKLKECRYPVKMEVLIRTIRGYLVGLIERYMICASKCIFKEVKRGQSNMDELFAYVNVLERMDKYNISFLPHYTARFYELLQSRDKSPNRTGYSAIIEDNYKKSIVVYNKEQSMHRLAVYYIRNHKNIDEAKGYLSVSYGQFGYVPSICLMAKLIFNGKLGLEVNEEMAIHLYQDAFKKGSKAAAYELAIIFKNSGCPVQDVLPYFEYSVNLDSITPTTYNERLGCRVFTYTFKKRFLCMVHYLKSQKEEFYARLGQEKLFWFSYQHYLLWNLYDKGKLDGTGLKTTPDHIVATYFHQQLGQLIDLCERNPMPHMVINKIY